MLRLDLSNTPHWLELAAGLRVQLTPLTTALMVAARNDEVVAALPDDARDETRALVFAKAIARLAILDWEGVGDTKGKPIKPSPKTIDALLDLYPVFEAFQLRYVGKGLLLEQEKNVCAPLPNGSSAGAQVTVRRATPAKPARKRAPIARAGATGR